MPLNPWKDFGTKSDYYPFGSPMDGRTFGSEKYRFGFNTQEKVNEISGDGNHNTAMFWEYDTRLGRRWNIDPVIKPWMSSYHAFSNKPIYNIDPSGDNDTKYYDKKTNELIADIDDGIDQSVKVDKEQFDAAVKIANLTQLDINKRKDALTFTSNYKLSSELNPDVVYDRVGWWTTINDVLDEKNQMLVRFNGNCHKTVKEQLNNAGVTPGGSDEAFYLFVDNNIQQQYRKPSLSIDVNESLKTIDNNLKKGYPVMAGVNYARNQGLVGNRNMLTVHFITIVGRGNDVNGNFYIYWDGLGSTNNTFYNHLYFKNNELRGSVYKVTEVRPNR